MPSQVAVGICGERQWGCWGISRRSILEKTTGLLRKTGSFFTHSYSRDLHNILARPNVRVIYP